MKSNNIIVLHYADTNFPVVVDIDEISAVYKNDDAPTTTLYVGSWLITVKETVGTIIQKIITVENNKNKEN